MVAMSRIRVEWAGTGVVGGGISTWYTTGSLATVMPAISQFYNNTLSHLPTAVQIYMPVGGEVLESTTGVLTGAYTYGPTIPVKSGGATGAYAAGVGYRCVWNTAGITRGRRVRGSTYIVPVAVGAYDGSGTISDTIVTNINTAIATMMTAVGSDLVVWSRPSVAGASDGAAHPILSGAVADKVSWLRTRRT